MSKKIIGKLQIPSFEIAIVLYIVFLLIKYSTVENYLDISITVGDLISIIGITVILWFIRAIKEIELN